MIEPFCITRVKPKPISFSHSSLLNLPVPSASSSASQMVCCISLYIVAVLDTITIVVFVLILDLRVRHINLTAKDMAPMISCVYPLLPIKIGTGCLPLGNGHENKNQRIFPINSSAMLRPCFTRSAIPMPSRIFPAKINPGYFC